MLDFSGVSQSLNFGSASSLDNIWAGGGTLTAWIEVDTYGQSSTGRIFTKQSGTGGTGWRYHVSSSNNAMHFQQSSGIFDAEWRSPTNSIPADSALRHVALAYNKSSQSNVPIFYIEGQLVSTTQITSPFSAFDSDAASSLLFGDNTADNRAFNGRGGDARAYNRILSAVEIQAIFQTRGHDGILDGLVGRWLMNEDSTGQTATAVPDLSNFKNDGSIVGSPSYVARPFSFRRQHAWQV